MIDSHSLNGHSKWNHCLVGNFMFTVRDVPCVLFCSFKTGFVDERTIDIDHAFRLAILGKYPVLTIVCHTGICIGHATRR